MHFSLTTLYVEELKASMRGRFAWLGAATALLLIGGLATVGTQDVWLDGYGIIAYGLVPLGFIPIAAGTIASPRASRFVESVFTAPVKRGDWFSAKILVLFTFAAAYYLALLPMMLVYLRHVAAPLLLREFLLWTPGLLIVSIAVGTLIGVLFIGRSLAAPIGAAMGVLLSYAGLIPLQELLVAQGNGATRSGHLMLASPAVLLKNALGFTLVAANVPATTSLTWVCLVILVVGAFALAAWIFLRAQGVETWEATCAQRWMIVLGILLLTGLPPLLADTNYDAPAPRTNNAPAIRALFSRSGASVALVSPGGVLPTHCCSTILNRDEWWPLSTDEDTRRDLLLLLPVDSDRTVRDVHAAIVGENGLQIRMLAQTPMLERHSYVNESVPVTDAGHHVVSGWVARIPVLLRPTKPWDIGGDRYPLSVTASYDVVGEAAPRKFSARAAVNAQVGPAITEMAFAASILPLLCLMAALLRWRRTR